MRSVGLSDSCGCQDYRTPLSAEGLGKLKPRLSRKRKRALFFVSDSSTALCKSNRKGVLTKSDLDEEVKWSAFALGWSEVRYSMCWGKTLASGRWANSRASWQSP